MTGAQLIAPTGEKSILPGSTMKGAFVSLSPLPSEPPVQVVITEGYATALTVSQLTAGCVVAAISAGNLPNVAQSLRARWPEVTIFRTEMRIPAEPLLNGRQKLLAAG